MTVHSKLFLVFSLKCTRLAPENEQIDRLFDYVERTYIRGRRRNARFSMEIWNVYDLTIEKLQRTNNVVEGYHSKFQHMINCHHASLWKFLEHIRIDQRDNEIIMQQLIGGHTRIKHPIKKKYIEAHDRITNIVALYDDYKNSHEIDKYLRAISFNVKRYEDEQPDGEEETLEEA